MLSQALSSNRMFCIGNKEGEEDDSPISPYSTAGLVRACVRQDDGTSQLLLLGMRRIRFTSWVQDGPFKIAKIEPVTTVHGDAARTRELKDLVLARFSKLDHQARQLYEALVKNDNEELVCDVLSYHFTRCPKLQQKLLAEESLIRRFELIIEALDKHCAG